MCKCYPSTPDALTFCITVSGDSGHGDLMRPTEDSNELMVQHGGTLSHATTRNGRNMPGTAMSRYEDFEFSPGEFGLIMCKY